MNSLRVPLASALLLASFALPASADECLPTISEGWVRMPPVAMPMLAGFGRIANDCGEPVALVGADSAAFADVSIHETRIEDGISRMRAVTELAIDAGGSATLEPGGLHLMLMQPTRELAPGDTVQIDFQIEDGGVVTGEFEVRGPGA